MLIYIAGPEPFVLKLKKELLLSFYDIHLSSIPFRKETFKYIIKENEDIFWRFW